MKPFAVLRALVLPFSLLPALAMASDSALTLKLENDGLASSDDGHFTSGFELNWMTTPSEQNWLQRLAVALPAGLMGQADRVARVTTTRSSQPVSDAA